MMRGIGAVALSVGLVLTGACKREQTTEATPSAQKQVEQAQRESEKAFDEAKQAQEKARKEQEDVARAEAKVAEKQRELADAEAKAQQVRTKAEEAQAAARAQGQHALEKAQSAQARATEAQQQARTEAEAKHEAPPAAKPETEQQAPSPTTEPGREARPGTPQQRSPIKQMIDKLAHPEATAPMQSDEGVVKSVSGNEIVLERDNGSEIRFKTDESQTMPTAGQRITVRYRFEGTQPIVVEIEQE